MSTLYENYKAVIHHLLKSRSVVPGFRAQFKPQEHSGPAAARSLNAAFLIAQTALRLSYPARGYLESMGGDRTWGRTARAYLLALDAVERELQEADQQDAWLGKAMEDLRAHLVGGADLPNPRTMEKYYRVFFPEGVGLGPWQEPSAPDSVRSLRDRRTVTVGMLNPDPVREPLREILFTSNVLLTLPLNGGREENLSPSLLDGLRRVEGEEQVHWYDHPVPMGTALDRNEVVYGLRGFQNAVRFEAARALSADGSRARVLLSVSTTHEGLRPMARPYLQEALTGAGGLEDLEIYAATQKEVEELLEGVLLPAARKYLPGREGGTLVSVLGVDGEYGRHYSFLKAVAALFAVLLFPEVRGTYKFDLDQVFPQEELVRETGRSAFEHLCAPLWGAEGVDGGGCPVHLGMLAGSLVNASDMGAGLHTPDVRWPTGGPAGDQWVFASVLPQVLSTEAEMATRYGSGEPDGKATCLQRVHVTGGTTGILVKALRRYRPFTPGWIGRAEDQAYLMSVLFPEEGPALRYVHADGLTMRHDKDLFAAEAMEAARTGKRVGDLVRILAFSSYARALPWDLPLIKSAMDPFSGCFISRLPVTVAWLRLGLGAASLFSEGTEVSDREGEEFVRMGAARLGEAMKSLGDEDSVRAMVAEERAGWDLYYDVLDALEDGLEKGDPFARTMRARARELVEGWRIRTESGV